MRKLLTGCDAKFARKAIATEKATDDEVAFLDTMLVMEAAREPVSEAEYMRLQVLTGGALSTTASIFDR